MSTINLAGGNTLLPGGSFAPVRAASTGAPLNPATGGLLTVDGVTLAVGDRVLCKDETNTVNNGIYAAQTGPWVRTSDASGNTQLFQGMTVTCGPQGAVNAGQTFVCTATDDPVVVGTSLLTFVSQAVVQAQQQTATSTTSLTIGTGSKTLAIQSGKTFQTNQEVLIYETSNTANSMLGSVTSYSGTSLVVQVTNTAGSGTHTDWTVVLFGSVAAAGITPPIGVGNVTGPGSSTTGHIATFADTTGKVLQDSNTSLGSLASLSAITAQYLASSALGFATGMVNGTLSASVAANAMTITVKTLAGATPSASDPVWFLVANGTGGFTAIELTSALSITVPTGASLGTVNAQANRIWVAVFNNSGTPVLGVYNSLNSTGPTILCWDETSTSIGNAIASGSNSPQTWYTASSLAASNFRIIGYVESTQSTAGTWATSPSKVQLFGPGQKKPGDFVQRSLTTITAQPTTTSTTFVAMTGANAAIAPISAANVISVRGSVYVNQAGGHQIDTQFSRGTAAATGLFGGMSSAGGSAVATSQYVMEGWDIPNTVSSTTYAIQARTVNGSSIQFGINGSNSSPYTIGLDEIQT